MSDGANQGAKLFSKSIQFGGGCAVFFLLFCECSLVVSCWPAQKQCLLSCQNIRVCVFKARAGSAKRQFSGLVNFVTSVAYHFCTAMTAALTQPGDHLLAEPYVHIGDNFL